MASLKHFTSAESYCLSLSPPLTSLNRRLRAYILPGKPTMTPAEALQYVQEQRDKIGLSEREFPCGTLAVSPVLYGCLGSNNRIFQLEPDLYWFLVEVW